MLAALDEHAAEGVDVRLYKGTYMCSDKCRYAQAIFSARVEV